MSNIKEKKIAFGSAVFLHIIVITLCFIFKLSYSAEEQKEDFSGVIFISNVDLNFEKEIEGKESEVKETEINDQEKEIEEMIIVDNEVEHVIDDKVNLLFEKIDKNKNSKEEVDNKGCTDSSAYNYNPNVKYDDGTCAYAIENMEDAFLNGPRKKIKGGDLKYDCPVKNIVITYELKITVLTDGTVRVDDCIDKDGVGNKCFEESAISAAESIKFESSNTNDNGLINEGKNVGWIMYSFAPL